MSEVNLKGQPMGSNYQPYQDITSSMGNDEITNSTDSVSKGPFDFYH